MAFGCVLIIALNPLSGASASDVTNVSTPSGSAHGGLVSGNIPCAIAANAIGDCGKTAPAGAIVGTSDTQTLTNKTIAGAQNTFSNIPDSALSTNVDLLNAAQSAGGLKTFSGGLALPSGSNPSGSNFYEDANGNLHFVSPFMDAQIVGGKFAGDASRPWFTSPFGSGISQTSSGQSPNFQINRNDKFNGGSGLTFGQRIIYTSGNGFSSPTTAVFAAGVTTITVTPNANFAVGQPLYGSGIAPGTTISTYSSGTIGLSTGLSVSIPQGTQISSVIGSTGISPTNQPVGIEAELDQYSNQTSTIASPNAVDAYLNKWVPSTAVSEGSNVVCHDYTGRKSSVAGPCIGAEEDVVASGPDDSEDRYILELTGAESAQSADGPTDIFAGIRIRPQSAESQGSPNSITFDNGILLTTMPGGAANGVFGNFSHGFNCGGGETIGCHDAISEVLIHSTNTLAPSGQNQILFALATSINVGQVVSGSSSIPSGTTVSAVYQCDATMPAGCGTVTNATLVLLSGNLTGNIASGTALTFTGTLKDGSNFNAWFNDAFANWTNQSGTGWLKAGTISNSGPVFDIRGQGEDSTNTPGVGYGDLVWAIDVNAHGSTLGHIGVANAGFEVGSPTGGNEGVGTINAIALYQNGSSLGSNAFTSTSFLPVAGGTLTGTLTDAAGDTIGAGGISLNANVAANGKTFNGLGGLLNNNSSGFELAGGASTATNAIILPNRSDAIAGIGGVAGHVSLIADSSGTAVQVLDISSSGAILKSGSFTGVDNGTWGSGGINGSAIGATTPSAGTFTTLTNTGHIVSNGPAQSCSNITFGGGAGTTPTCNSVTGDDHKFNINFTTGTSPGTSAAIWTLTVASYASAPNCVFAAVGGNTAASITKFLVSSTTTTVVMNVGSSALAASTAYNMNVQCTG